jgi:hypothetical protein
MSNTSKDSLRVSVMRCGSSFVIIGAQMSTRKNVRGGKYLGQVMKILLKTEEDLDHSQRHNKYWYAYVYSFILLRNLVAY